MASSLLQGMELLQRSVLKICEKVMQIYDYFLKLNYVQVKRKNGLSLGDTIQRIFSGFRYKFILSNDCFDFYDE